ncbi:hypothetical protein RYX36_037126 [Vicia faba]
MSCIYLLNGVENSLELLPSPYDELDYLKPPMIQAPIQIPSVGFSDKDIQIKINPNVIENDFDESDSNFDKIKNLVKSIFNNDDDFDYDESVMDYIMAELMKHGARIGSNHILEVPSCKEKPSIIQNLLE